LYYFDTSAVIRAYFVNEDDHDLLRRLLFEGTEPVVTSELTRVELTSATVAAFRAQRLADPGMVLDRFDLDCGDGGVITLLRLDPVATLPMARQLVIEHPLRSLDAIHLAVLITAATRLAAGEPVTLVTKDKQQATAAQALGLPVA
jgi:predicted nucleic acid-binding protein